MEKKRTSMILAIIAIVIAIVGMSVSFASFSTQLDINGYAEMGSANRKIYFDNLSQANLTGTALELAHPSIQNESTSITTFDVRLNNPGDAISYTFNIVNDGGLDAKLTTLDIPMPVCRGSGLEKDADEELVCNNLEYTLTKSDGTALSLGDVIEKGESIIVRLTLSYHGDALPYEVVGISNLGIDLIYSQN